MTGACREMARSTFVHTRLARALLTNSSRFARAIIASIRGEQNSGRFRLATVCGTKLLHVKSSSK